jgi:hypothetical protein
VQRVWLQVALAAGAGLGSLAVCSGAVVAIVLLLIASMTFGAGGPLSSDPALFWVGVVTVLLFAWASLSLSPLALGARGGHALKTTLLSGLCFCGFVLIFFLSLTTVSPVPRLMALAALIATPAIGSLGAILEGGMIAARPLRATLIAAVAIYCASCASLFAFWSVSGDDWHGVRAGMVVAAASWPVLPGIVAMLRSG